MSLAVWKKKTKTKTLLLVLMEAWLILDSTLKLSVFLSLSPVFKKNKAAKMEMSLKFYKLIAA